MTRCHRQSGEITPRKMHLFSAFRIDLAQLWCIRPARVVRPRVSILKPLTYRGLSAMADPQDLIDKACNAARHQSLPFAGALSPADAWQLLQTHPDAVLVDVRTRAEWAWVGRVPRSVEIEWNQYPSGRNPEFAAQLQAAIPERAAPVLFLCRSGGRSAAAAETAAGLGYTLAINVLEGFEGDLDGEGHRNTVGGWRKAGLPWIQS
jgi:rhodanese-related sulfurtransferase